MRSATRAVGPTILAGLLLQSATPSGAASIFQAVNDNRIDTGIVGKLSNIFGNRGSLDSMMSLGESLAGTVFGNRSGAVTSALSQVAGIKPGSALTLLSTALPVVFGMLRKTTTQNGLDAGGLTALLAGQRNALEKTGLDNRLTNALGFGSLSSLLGSTPSAYATPTVQPLGQERRASRNWIPWAIAAGVAALAFALLFNRPTNDRTSTRTAAGQTTSDSIRLASAKVYFDTGNTSINAADRQKIASVAQTARDQGRPITITGYTDRTGDTTTNLEVAKNRASAVRDALVAEGVSESRIVMDPPATVTGTGTDAEARRVEIVVR
jgi:outer membrane protein OmpA-like peptidoglycan-associated protein